MRQFSPGLQNHLQGEAATICNCWVIERKDGTRLGFTDHDNTIVVGETVCEPSSGFEASQMEETTGLAPDNHEILGALLSDRISEDDLSNRRYDGARIRHYIVNWTDPTEYAQLEAYLFGEITCEDGVFRAELKSLLAQLDETNLRRFDKTCSADLGDNACGLDLVSTHKHAATVGRVLAPTIFEVLGVGAFDSNWFSGGRVVFQEGTSDESAIEITLHVKNEVGEDICTLWEAPPTALETGQALTLYPGCDKQLDTCQHKFANALNFQGYPFMPGPDFAASYASNSDRMDGGPLVK